MQTSVFRAGPDGRFALVFIKVVHTAIWGAVEGAVLYLLVTGLARRSGRGAVVAAAIVATETVVYLGNGARCPLTGVAESLGADRGTVTDVFLPRWLAKSLPAIHVPLMGLIAWLHLRNLRAGHR